MTQRSGYLQKQFHAADIALRAVQAYTSIVVAGTNGPTMIVIVMGLFSDHCTVLMLVYPGRY